MSLRAHRLLVLAPALGLVACAAGSSPTTPNERPGEGAIADAGAGADDAEGAIEAELSSPRSAYSFFVAVKASSGFAITRLNGAWMRCGSGRYDDTCPVDAIDLAPSGLGAKDARSVVDALGDDPRAPSVVLLGRVFEDAGGSTLKVYELWRAPEARRLDGDVLHLSHGPTRALWVNDWSAAPISSLDFAGAPTTESCGLVDGEYTCAPSFDRAQKAAASKVGLLAVGSVRGDRSVLVTQYFLQVSLGDRHTSDGFGFCKATQAECDDGTCREDPTLCHVNSGTGRGQIQPARFDAPRFRNWLLLTTQALPADFAR